MAERQRLLAELRRELEDEWAYNHVEHCSREWPHKPGYRCAWPRPPILDDPGLDEVPSLPDFEDPPYLRRKGPPERP